VALRGGGAGPGKGKGKMGKIRKIRYSCVSPRPSTADCPPFDDSGRMEKKKGVRRRDRPRAALKMQILRQCKTEAR